MPARQMVWHIEEVFVQALYEVATHRGKFRGFRARAKIPVDNNTRTDIGSNLVHHLVLDKGAFVFPSRKVRDEDVVPRNKSDSHPAPNQNPAAASWMFEHE